MRRKWSKNSSRIAGVMTAALIAGLLPAGSLGQVHAAVTAAEDGSISYESTGTLETEENLVYGRSFIYGNRKYKEDNAHAQNYSVNWATVVTSYIVAGENGTYYTVDYTGGSEVLVTLYDKNGNRLTEQKIPMELSLFGGFYAGNDGYYFVFGQNNEEEDDSKEVIRIVKYGKNWIREESTGLYGANTIYPFFAGSLRMVQDNNALYIRTCHAMYATSDGVNHQANVTIQVDTSNMQIVNSNYSITNIYTGYVSHSFNQFVALDGDRLVAADHGDAHPRSMVVGRYQNIATGPDLSGWWGYEHADMLSLTGEYGENYTGATLGGLEVTDTSYMIAGSTIIQDENYRNNVVRNVFVATVSKDQLDDSSVNYRLISQYQEGGTYSASNTQLVKVADDYYAILWEEGVKDGSIYYNEDGHQVVKVAFVDGDGNLLGDVQQITGQLSDCKPEIINNRVTWYVTNNGNTTFYSFSADVDNVEGFVGRMYSKALGRQAEAKGLHDWTNRLLLGLCDGAGISNGFIESDEFAARKLSNSEYVDTLYRTFFDREPDESGKNDWMETLESGNSRHFVLCGFVNSQEFTNLCNKYGIIRGTMDTNGETAVPRITEGIRNFVKRLYNKALNREGEEDGITYWSRRIANKEITPEDAAKNFFQSEEFINRSLNNSDYVETLYQTFMDRASDAVGKAYWVGKLDAGMDRMTVLEGFSRSVEFQVIVKSYGLE